MQQCAWNGRQPRAAERPRSRFVRAAERSSEQERDGERWREEERKVAERTLAAARLDTNVFSITYIQIVHVRCSHVPQRSMRDRQDCIREHIIHCYLFSFDQPELHVWFSSRCLSSTQSKDMCVSSIPSQRPFGPRSFSARSLADEEWHFSGREMERGKKKYYWN